MDEIYRDAYAVLLPAFGDADFTVDSASFFRSGGVASLLGSTREEYVARRMSSERQRHETREQLSAYANRARALAGDVLIAVDYEVGGVHRLHHFGPQLAHPRDVLEMNDEEIKNFGSEAARAAKLCGVNFFLSPVVDLVTGRQSVVARSYLFHRRGYRRSCRERLHSRRAGRRRDRNGKAFPWSS